MLFVMQLRSMTISLDGLLDYDEEDREECTFELSLFAEVFHELLQFKMGSRILTSLEVYSSALATVLVTFGVYLYPQSGADEVKWGVMATSECHLQ
jgi:hypothetical protein